MWDKAQAKKLYSKTYLSKNVPQPSISDDIFKKNVGQIIFPIFFKTDSRSSHELRLTIVQSICLASLYAFIITAIEIINHNSVWDNKIIFPLSIVIVVVLSLCSTPWVRATKNFVFYQTKYLMYLTGAELTSTDYKSLLGQMQELSDDENEDFD